MANVLVTGAGKIGCLIARLLSNESDYAVSLIDINSAALKENTKHFPDTIHCEIFNIQDKKASDWIKAHNIDTIVSCLPYHQNFRAAELAHQLKLHYFDLTEDTRIKDIIREIAQTANTAFVPHCGLAPG